MSYPDSEDLRARVASIVTEYEDSERAESTLDAYRLAWKDFRSFCNAMGVESLPADGETVAQYILYCAEDRDLALATLRKRLAGIRFYHRKNEHASPTATVIVREALEQVRRRKGAGQRQAKPLLTSHVTKMVDELRPGRKKPEGTAAVADWLRDQRDAAIITVGFTGAFRRGEMCSMTIENTRISAERARFHLPKSKTDQEKRGETVTIQAGSTRHCPVRALSRWINTAGIGEGPIFRRVRGTAEVGEDSLTGKSMLRAVRGAAKTAGIEGYITPHSLRAGYATQAVLNGVSSEEVMKHMRLTSVHTFMRYVRIAEEHTADMTGALGL